MTIIAGLLEFYWRSMGKMVKFAANLSMLFNEFDFLERFDLASQTGFKGVEYLFPYDYEEKVLSEILEENNLVQVLHNLPSGDWENGERGIACMPDRVDEFKSGVEDAIRYAKALNCDQLNCLAGIRPNEVPDKLLRETFVANLRFAASLLGEEGIKLCIEPINTIDIPGFYLTDTDQSKSIMAEVKSDNLMLQYDVYHMQIMEGDLSRTIESNIDIVGHVQIADNPGRNEPGTGEINYPHIFSLLDKVGYTGWVGCEYFPSTTTEASLDWARKWI